MKTYYINKTFAILSYSGLMLADYRKIKKTRSWSMTIDSGEKTW